jgi:hypothetical protein
MSGVPEERLRALQDDIQSRCFYWKTTHKRGGCLEANGRFVVRPPGDENGPEQPSTGWGAARTAVADGR